MPGHASLAEGLSLDTLIRRLPGQAFTKLSAFLDYGNLWERLAVEVPANLADIESDNCQLRYSHSSIQWFAQQGSRAGARNSPTVLLLQNWGTQQARVRHLITVLVRAELYAAADYLHNDLLHLGPASRPPLPAHAPRVSPAPPGGLVGASPPMSPGQFGGPAPSPPGRQPEGSVPPVSLPVPPNLPARPALYPPLRVPPGPLVPGPQPGVSSPSVSSPKPPNQFYRSVPHVPEPGPRQPSPSVNSTPTPGYEPPVSVSPLPYPGLSNQLEESMPPAQDSGHASPPPRHSKATPAPGASAPSASTPDCQPEGPILPASSPELPSPPEGLAPPVPAPGHQWEGSVTSGYHAQELLPPTGEETQSVSHLVPQSLGSGQDQRTEWIGVEDLETQHVSHALLACVTNNFHHVPLSQGGNLLGQGGFGSVYLGRFSNGFPVAVKVLQPTAHTDLQEEELVRQFNTEVMTLSAFRHRNVVQLLGFSVDDVSRCLVYQYLPNGSLEDRLHSPPPLPPDTRISIAKDAACGIHYLNDHKHVHRDIKSANILLDHDYRAKVGDFATVVSAPSGSSQTVAKSSRVIGTNAYMAPEAHTFDISTKLDAYSFGVVLLEIMTGLPVVDDTREERVITSYVMENVTQASEMHQFADQSAGSWREGAIEKLYDIAMKCLELTKKKRPNVSDIRPQLETV